MYRFGFWISVFGFRVPGFLPLPTRPSPCTLAAQSLGIRKIRNLKPSIRIRTLALILNLWVQVLDFGFRFSGSEFSFKRVLLRARLLLIVWGLGVRNSEFRVSEFGFRFPDSGFPFPSRLSPCTLADDGQGFTIQGFGYMVYGFTFRVWVSSYKDSTRRGFTIRLLSP